MTTREPREETWRTGGRKASRSFWVLGNRFVVLANHADTADRYDLFEGHQPPGLQTPLHVHNGYDERLYVVEGELTVWVGGPEGEVLRAGDTINIPAGARHVVASTGEGIARALLVASPSGLARVVEEVGIPDEGDAPPAFSPADVERFQEAASELGDVILGPPGTLPS